MPLLIGFAGFLLLMGYLVASSFTRRAAPTFAPTAAGRARAAEWERRGDTLTVDARDGDRWLYVSLREGRVLAAPDTTGWDVAVRRYHLVAGAAAVDLGAVPFDALDPTRTLGFAELDRSSGPAPAGLSVTTRWYRYSLLTHLLESNRHVYAVLTPQRDVFKVQILSYYCPGLTAGCMTLRYAPLAPRRHASRP